MKKIVYVLALVVGISCLSSLEAKKAKKAKKSKGLYEIVIANNTNMPLHWHMKTTGNDYNDEIQPGDAYVFHTSGLLQRLTITFKQGNKVQRRGYPIPGLQSGKDWIFSVNKEPFKGPWNVCGSWAHTRVQGEATLAAEIAGLTVGTAALVSGGALAAAVAAPATAAIGLGAVTGLAKATIVGGGAIGASIGAGVITTLAKGKHLGLSRTMHKDTCKWYGK